MTARSYTGESTSSDSDSESVIDRVASTIVGLFDQNYGDRAHFSPGAIATRYLHDEVTTQAARRALEELEHRSKQTRKGKHVDDPLAAEHLFLKRTNPTSNRARYTVRELDLDRRASAGGSGSASDTATLDVEADGGVETSADGSATASDTASVDATVSDDADEDLPTDEEVALSEAHEFDSLFEGEEYVSPRTALLAILEETALRATLVEDSTADPERAFDDIPVESDVIGDRGAIPRNTLLALAAGVSDTSPGEAAVALEDLERAGEVYPLAHRGGEVGVPRRVTAGLFAPRTEAEWRHVDDEISPGDVRYRLTPALRRPGETGRFAVRTNGPEPTVVETERVENDRKAALAEARTRDGGYRE